MLLCYLYVLFFLSSSLLNFPSDAVTIQTGVKEAAMPTEATCFPKCMTNWAAFEKGGNRKKRKDIKTHAMQEPTDENSSRKIYK